MVSQMKGLQIYDRYPLNVDFNDSSLNVNDNWNPENVNSDVVAAVEVVSLR
jgi:hypothetical protein